MAEASVPMMSAAGGGSAWLAIVRQLCPRCRRGRIFRRSIFTGFPKMHQLCPACGLNFEREEGYFLGAMYISYGIALVLIVAIAAVLWYFTGCALDKLALWSFIGFLPLAPTVTLFSRVCWIYLDQAVDPDRPDR